MPVCAEAKPPGCVPATERYVTPLTPASFTHGQATSLAALQRAEVLRLEVGAVECREKRADVPSSCKVALPDLSVLLCMCHLCKAHFDKLPVK